MVGAGPVRELLASAPTAVRRIWVAPSERGQVAEIAESARAAGIAVQSCEPGELDRMAEGTRHQGVIAETRPYRYADVDDMLAAAEAAGEPPLIVALDGVTDPRNLGAIARSAYLLGAHGIVVPRDRAAEVTPTSTKVSAGAVEHIAIAQVTNLARTLGELKEAGLWIHGVAAEEGAQELATTDLKGPTCLVLGSEGSGLRPLVAKACDLFAVIPMTGEHVGSFNVGVAAALALYECRRQRLVG
ncbi:MAG: 23S rRNA (guanosine(2251)-2'-O)-methyltransferase RlmB [Deltaproteobacteria bacterium]|nr:23S rRNA (guanosine(2251)-2'-O)-methyltransferase RlmB [Deltaproteobacteria bacterium]